MSGDKSTIRKQVLQYRRLMDQAVFDHRNQLLRDRVIGIIEESRCKCVHTFLPISRNREVDTWPLIERLVAQDISVVVSATDFVRQSMSHYHYTPELKFEKDQFGIPTPISGTSADMQQVDLVLIPMLAADKSGNRIGYGKGYYDRLLAELSLQVLKVGLLLGPLFDDFNLAEAHDISLDYCVMPPGIIKFDNSKFE